MIIELKRRFYADTYTIGTLSIDGKRVCDTLEDKVRNMPKEAKVHGQTAIPCGTYEVIMNYSNHFKKRMPLLLSVPYFEGVRLHAGNSAKDTEGCILVGENKVKGMLINSRKWADYVTARIDDAINNKQRVTITIV